MSDEIEQLKQRVEKWASSPEGKAKINEAMRKAGELTRRLQDAQRVDRNILQQPMTI